MTITRVGTNQTYSDGWDTAFGGKRGTKTAGKSSVKTKKAAASKKAKPKKSGKKSKR